MGTVGREGGWQPAKGSLLGEILSAPRPEEPREIKTARRAMNEARDRAARIEAELIATKAELARTKVALARALVEPRIRAAVRAVMAQTAKGGAR